MKNAEFAFTIKMDPCSNIQRMQKNTSLELAADDGDVVIMKSAQHHAKWW